MKKKNQKLLTQLFAHPQERHRRKYLKELVRTKPLMFSCLRPKPSIHLTQKRNSGVAQVMDKDGENIALLGR